MHGQDAHDCATPKSSAARFVFADTLFLFLDAVPAALAAGLDRGMPLQLTYRPRGSVARMGICRIGCRDPDHMRPGGSTPRVDAGSWSIGLTDAPRYFVFPFAKGKDSVERRGAPKEAPDPAARRMHLEGASKNRGGRAAQGCAAILNHGK
jgi:hypothetical protein